MLAPDHAGRTRRGRTEFEAASHAVLRVALAAREAPSGTDTRAPEDPERLAALARTFLGDEALAAALELASPDLAAALREPAPRRGRDRRRMTIALTGYLLRSRNRATPFGLFAGAAVIPVGDTGTGEIGIGHELLVRPAPQWLAGVVAGIEADPGLAELAPRVRLSWAAGLRLTRSDAIVLDEAVGHPGSWRAARSARRSRLLNLVLALTDPRRGTAGVIGYGALLDLLATAAAGTGREELARYVAGLLAAGLLATDLQPPPGHADPLGYVSGKLGGHPAAAALRGLRAGRRQLSAPVTGAGLPQVRARLRCVHEDAAGLVADVRVATDLSVPREVAREVEKAASVAWACAPAAGARPLAALHSAVLSRYGPGRPVRLADLLDPAESLGLAGGPEAAPTGPVPPGGAERGLLLTGLALDAMSSGRAELTIDETVVRRLAAYSGRLRPAPSLDVFTEVIAASWEALNAGDYLVRLGGTSGPGPAGSSAGRLASLLGPDAARLARVRPPGDHDPLDVELVHRPPCPSDAALVGQTGWTEFRIDLTATAGQRSETDITPAELDVIATCDRFRLHSRRLGRDVRPVSFSTLDPRRAGPLARLLLALGAEGTDSWRSWDWGDADSLPWLPRVRVGRAILAAARWAIPRALRHLAIVGPERQWVAEVQRWAERAELPEVVFEGGRDRRLPLDLRDPVHAALLRRECRQNAVTWVAEPPGGVAAWRGAAWPRGPGGVHAAEIVFSLRPRAETTGSAGRGVEGSAGGSEAPGRSRPSPVQPVPDASGPTSAVSLPGGEWLCAVLSVPEVSQDSVLAGLADPDLSGSALRAGVDRWFYVRLAGADGVPQIVVRFHGPPGGLGGSLLAALHDWSARLRAAGMLRDLYLASYWPEEWRYGGRGCMAAAEEFFCCDSRLCAESLAAAPGAARAELLAAPGAARILAALAGQPDAGNLPSQRLSVAERRLFNQLRPLARAGGTAGGTARPSASVCLRKTEGRGTAVDWDEALAGYRGRLIAAGRDPMLVASSLVHMHCNRLAGPDEAAERVAFALARDLLWTRPSASPAAGQRRWP